MVFFGDSITQSGGYVADIEVFLLTRFHDRTFSVFNHGRSSETISGTSELDHHPRRPDAHLRFTRDAVHPGPTGHWLIAQSILLAWHAPSKVAEARIIVGDEAPHPGRDDQ